MAARILVVDDEREYSFDLSERLRHRDYDVQFCFGGNEALEMLSRRPFDVVVLSVAMPQMDGISTLKEIKRRHPLTEVILHCKKDTTQKAVRGMWMGAFECLAKPCKIEQITAKVNEAFLYKFAQEERIRKAKMRLAALRGQPQKENA